MSMPAPKNKVSERSAYGLDAMLLKHFYWICLALLAAFAGGALFNFVLAQL
jgi:hypothetical protein